MCKYKKGSGGSCSRDPISDRGLCLLHEDWDHKSEKDTEKQFYQEIESGETDFEGCILPGFDLPGKKFEGDLNFAKAKIKGDANFYGAIIGGDAWFDRAVIGGNAQFSTATGGRLICFDEAKIRGSVLFNRATIKGLITFAEATIKGDVHFVQTRVGGHAKFFGATIKGDALFWPTDISFLTFFDAVFYNMGAQKEACRAARITQEKAGDRSSADYHFYREMVAKRKLKYLWFSLDPILKFMLKLRLSKVVHKHRKFFEKRRRVYYGFLEAPVQYISGYGAYWHGVLITWFLVVFLCGLIFWGGKGVMDPGPPIVEVNSFWQNIYFSIVTATTLGYGDYQPKPGPYQGLAAFEAISGTFMWAAFITIFARKYMR